MTVGLVIEFVQDICLDLVLHRIAGLEPSRFPIDTEGRVDPVDIEDPHCRNAMQVADKAARVVRILITRLKNPVRRSRF